MTNSSTPEFSQQSRKTLATQKSMFPKVESIISEKFSKQDSFSGKACQLVQTFRQLLPTNYRFESNVWPSLSSDDISKEVKQKKQDLRCCCCSRDGRSGKIHSWQSNVWSVSAVQKQNFKFSVEIEKHSGRFCPTVGKTERPEFFFSPKKSDWSRSVLVDTCTLCFTLRHWVLLSTPNINVPQERENERERESGCAWWMSMQRRLEKSNKSRRERNREAEKLF